MLSHDQLESLFAEMRAWCEEGLIDEATHRRLLERYEPKVESGCLEAGLDAKAEELLRGRPVEHVPELDEHLAAEAQAHLTLEQQVVAEQQAEIDERQAAAAAAAERPAALGAAAKAAATDLASLAVPDRAATPIEHSVLERESLWSSRVRPFLYGNALWLAGGLLVLFGSLYFLRLIWDDLSSLFRHAVIASSLHVYAAAFFGTGYLLARRRQAHMVARILFCFTIAILPLGSVALGELVALLLQRGGAVSTLVAAGCVLVAVAIQACLLVLIGGLLERASIATLLQGWLGLCLLVSAVAPLKVLLPPPIASLLLLVIPLGFAMLAARLLSLCRARVWLRSSLLLAGGGLLWSFVVLIVRAQVAWPIEPTHNAALLAAVSALLIACDHRLRVRSGNPPRLSPLGLLMHAPLLLAVPLSVTGLVSLGYFHLGARLGVLLTSAIALWVFARSSCRYGRSAFTYLAASSGLLTYFFLPAPFAGLLVLIQHRISVALGYSHEPLPVAFYGLTFIPYLLLVAGIALGLRRVRPDLSRDLQRFVAAIGSMLVLLAFAGRGDIRPMLWAWPLYALFAYLSAWLFAFPAAIYAGHLLALGSLWVLGIHLEPQRGIAFSTPTLVAAFSLSASIGSLVRRAQSQPKQSPHWSDDHLGHAAAVGIIAALLALILPVRGLEQALTATLMVTASLGVLAVGFRARLSAHLTAFGLLASLLLGETVGASLDSHNVPVALLVMGGLATVIVGLGRHADSASARHRLVSQPATVLAALSMSLALLSGMLLLAAPFALLPAAALVFLAFLARGTIPTVLASAAIAASVGLNADLLLPRSWPTVLSALAALFALAAPRLPSRWPAAERRRIVLTVCGFLVASAALIGSLQFAGTAESAAEGYFWGFLAALGVSVFLLGLALAYRKIVEGAIPLGALALSSSAAALLLLRATVDPMRHGLWAYGLLAALLACFWLGLHRVFSQPHQRRTALISATLLAVLPLVEQGGYLLFALLRCEAPGGWLLGMISLAPGGWACLCGVAAFAAALLLHAVRRDAIECSAFNCLLDGPRGLLAHSGFAAGHRRGRSPRWSRSVRTRAARPTSQQILICAILGLVLGVHGWLAPTAHLTLPLSASAIALAAWPRTSSRPIPLLWPMAVAGTALLASHLHLQGPGPCLAGTASSLSLLLLWRRERKARFARALGYSWSLALLGTSQLLAIWVGAELSTGRYPAESVLALMGLAAFVMALLLDLVSSLHARPELQPAAQIARFGSLLGAGLGAIAVITCRPIVPTFVTGLAVALLAGGALRLLILGGRDRREWAVYAALIELSLAYLVARSHTPLASLGPWLDGATLLVAAQIGLAVGRWGSVALFRRPLLIASALWPGLALLLLPEMSRGGAALLCLLTALHYGAMASQLQVRHFVVPGLLFATIAALLGFAALDWSDLLLQATTVALTLLVLTHVYRQELGRSGSNSLRAAMLLCVYTLGVAEGLTAVTPVQAMVVVPLLCMAGMLAGTLLRVRAYVLMGVSFLAADLILNMLRYGLASRPLGALFLTLLGLAIVSAMVVFTVERERILRRYSAFMGQLRTWD